MQTALTENIAACHELCASGLQAPFAKVLEYEPDEKRLMVRAGVGWPLGTIDIVSLARRRIAGRLRVPDRRVLISISGGGTRFPHTSAMADHGVRRAINVLIEKGERATPSSAFSKSTARIPASRSGRRRFSGRIRWPARDCDRTSAADARLQEALKHQALLTREMSHRSRTATSVVGLLRVQARSAQSQDVKNALGDASLRSHHSRGPRSPLAQFARRLRELADFMTSLQEAEGQYRQTHSALPLDPMLLSATRNSLGLLINELVNQCGQVRLSGRYGEIEVSAEKSTDTFASRSLTMALAFPKGSTSTSRAASLGFKVVTGMVRQLQGHLKIDNDRKGARSCSICQSCLNRTNPIRLTEPNSTDLPEARPYTSTKLSATLETWPALRQGACAPTF